MNNIHIGKNIKYDYKPFIGSSHTWAMNNIKKENKDISILDIGSSIGMMGSILRENGFKNLDAVEVDNKARKIASKYYNNTYKSIDDATKTYDIVLLLDVLEHTVDNDKFFKQVVSLLNKNGTLLLSVPNIAHWYPRFSLLFGNFDYKEKGILDNTHLRFYTRKTIINFVLAHDNLSIKSVAVSTSSMEMFLSKKIVESFLYRVFAKLKLAIANLFPRLLGYQHLLVIKKER
ncbi:MAG: class I SAM-dependent methyltransferase [Bdellovibrionota bacterium]